MESKKSLKYLVPKILLGLLFVFIIFYAHSRTTFLSQGVLLSIENIEDGQTLKDPILALKGTAKRAIKLTLNNREILIDEEGNFTDTIILSPGLNRLIIEAEDKFNNYKQLTYTLWHEPIETQKEFIETLEESKEPVVENLEVEEGEVLKETNEQEELLEEPIIN